MVVVMIVTIPMVVIETWMIVMTMMVGAVITWIILLIL